MLTGQDVRQYRRVIKLGQVEFAKQLGIAQPTLSHIEGGNIPVSADHIQRLKAAFPSPKFDPSFDEFLLDLERGASLTQAALTTCASHHSTLTVWKWTVDFDLSRLPHAELAADLITVRGLSEPAIALQMPSKTSLWHKGEVIVFERCRRDEIEENGICLAQLKVSRSKGSRTVLAVARRSSGKRVLQLEPINSAGPAFTADDENLLALLRPVYRARRLKS